MSKLAPELQKIKDNYGERMAHFCREAFPTILETENKLYSILSSYFAPSKFLYNDIIKNHREVEFKNLINRLGQEKRERIIVNKNPFQLLSEAGYILFECHSEEEIQRFKKFYAPGEELCTFRGGRLERCYVFFAVKKNVNDIQRKNFPFPEREDEYGTSVIGIQITRDDNTLSIKSRYNHKVSNPDATFSNNLDNIIPGLTEAFNKEYGFSINRSRNENDLELPGYIKAEDGKYYKYNYVINNVYYCPNNIIIDNYRVKEYSKNNVIIMDYYILDTEKKTLTTYGGLSDSFPASIGKIDTVRVEIDKTTHTKKVIINEDIYITLDSTNRITKYENSKVEEISDKFLFHNTSLQELFLPNVKKIGSKFLQDNEIASRINISSVEEIGDDFLYSNESDEITELSFPKLRTIGDNFMSCHSTLQKLELPQVEKIGSYFLQDNMELKELELPKVKEIGENFLFNNKQLEKINLPSLEVLSPYFLKSNRSLKELALPNVRTMIPAFFLAHNEVLERIELPNIKMIDRFFLKNNKALKEIHLPSVIVIENGFLPTNKVLQELTIPKIQIIGDHFLPENTALQEIDLSSVETIGKCFLGKNTILQKITIPREASIGEDFLVSHPTIDIDSLMEEKYY